MVEGHTGIQCSQTELRAELTFSGDSLVSGSINSKQVSRVLSRI